MIYVSDEAKSKISTLKKESNIADSFFVRVGVVGGGCSGLSYTMDFDDEVQPTDQVFEDKGVKVKPKCHTQLWLWRKFFGVNLMLIAKKN